MTSATSRTVWVPPIVGWKVYTSKLGEVFDSRRHKWADVPHDAQVLIIFHEKPYRAQQDAERRKALPWAEDDWRDGPPLPDDLWQQIYVAARADIDWPE